MPEAVAVLGGGNTALDAAVTAKRLGARDVYIVYRRSFEEMPAWPGERDAALARGVNFLILTQPLGYLTDKKGRLTGVRIARTRLGEPDASGRRRPETILSSESTLEVGLAIEALGQTGAASITKALPGVELENGLIKTQPGSAATTADGVFAGGDVVNGGTTAARAVYEGYRAAGEIDQYLAEKTSLKSEG
jgi:glutamate synthase (NADPH/NADH) small chain